MQLFPSKFILVKNVDFQMNQPPQTAPSPVVGNRVLPASVKMNATNNIARLVSVNAALGVNRKEITKDIKTKPLNNQLMRLNMARPVGQPMPMRIASSRIAAPAMHRRVVAQPMMRVRMADRVQIPLIKHSISVVADRKAVVGANIKIQLENNSNPITSRTNANGKTLVRIPNGTPFSMEVTSEGFKLYEEEVPNPKLRNTNQPVLHIVELEKEDEEWILMAVVCKQLPKLPNPISGAGYT